MYLFLYVGSRKTIVGAHAAANRMPCSVADELTPPLAGRAFEYTTRDAVVSGHCLRQRAVLAYVWQKSSRQRWIFCDVSGAFRRRAIRHILRVQPGREDIGRLTVVYSI